MEPGPIVIRCLLLCWTGDHPAQCEIGKFLGTGGYSACRCDKVTDAYILIGQALYAGRKQLYYGNYRYHYRHQWSKRSLQEAVMNMDRVEDEDGVSIRRKIGSVSHQLSPIFNLTIVTSSKKHVRTSGLGYSVAHTFVALETKIHVYDANTRH